LQNPSEVRVFLLRPAVPADLEAVVELAGYLDSPNLPRDPAFLRARLERSERAFAQPGPPAAEREYQFALADPAGRVVGTCAILSKHGTRGSPHVYLQVGEEERYSPSAGVLMRHVVLQLRATWDGPTEIGSLVLHPDARGQAGAPGKLLSWGRFAYIARHRGSFEREVLAEMRAAIDSRGDNAFWDAFGRRFTGMSYADADRRSSADKTFILDLFPRSEFYASLLDAEVAQKIGEVHAEAAPALHLLQRAGMRWTGQVDPFDAGPYVGAAASDIAPIRETAVGWIADAEPDARALPAIVASEESGAFRAVAAPALVEGTSVQVAKEARERLGVSAGDEVSVTPLPTPRRRRSDG
jgi:arginine N-succinyltransferase